MHDSSDDDEDYEDDLMFTGPAKDIAKHEDMEYLRFNRVKSTCSKDDQNEKLKAQKIALLKQKSLDKKRKS